MRYPQALLLATGIAASTPQALAGNNRLEETIVVSSRIETPLRQVGAAVSVLTEQDLQAMGFNSLQDALRTQPGIGVSNAGGAGKASALRIRGEEGFRTLVLLDGINISDTTTPQIGPRLEQLLSSDFARVEILRGSQGMMYGADAGGVIKLESAQPAQGFGGQLSAEGGRFGTSQLAGRIGGSTDTLQGSLAVSDYQTDGFNASDTDTSLRDDDGFENRTVHGRLGWRIGEGLKLSAVARDVDSETEFDNCFAGPPSFAPSNDCSSTYEQQAWRLAADFEGQQFGHSLAYNASRTDNQNFTAGAATFGGEGEIDNLTYIGRFRSSDALQLVYGLDLRSEEFDDGFLARERDQDGAFIEYQGAFSNALYLTAGARYDDNDDFGTHTTYRLSAAYLWTLAGSTVKARAAYGTGFRAPSLFEEAYNSVSGFPPASDVDLQEETSEGAEIGIGWYADNGTVLEATLFDQTVTDEIFFDLEAFSGYLQGSGDTTSRGLELVSELPLGTQWQLTTNYTYNDTENTNGEDRLRRPVHLANIFLRWSTRDARLNLALHLRGSYDAIDVGGVALDDYELLNLNASFALLDNLQLYARVENLSDADYQELIGFNTAPRAAYAGLRYSF